MRKNLLLVLLMFFSPAQAQSSQEHWRLLISGDYHGDEAPTKPGIGWLALIPLGGVWRLEPALVAPSEHTFFHTAPGAHMKSNPVGWFEIYVQDMPRAKAFYEAVFQVGLTPLENPDPQGFPDMQMLAFPSSMEDYGAAGALVHMAGCPSGGSTLVYFSCEDCAAEAERAAANGGRLIKGKMSIDPHGFIAMVMDTEGNVIGLHSMQ
jgi:predicted enzyme related to lactoylglutathione lyase